MKPISLLISIFFFYASPPALTCGSD